jgi:hypothetical protein
VAQHADWKKQSGQQSGQANLLQVSAGELMALELFSFHAKPSHLKLALC